MLGAPALHARDLLGAAEIVAVLGFGQPPALTGSLARLTARGFGAIPLVPHIAHIGLEPRSAIQALTLSLLALHGPALPGADHATRQCPVPIARRTGTTEGKEKQGLKSPKKSQPLER
jgi:hypothetical protein